jgi:hypothetical protein
VVVSQHADRGVGTAAAGQPGGVAQRDLLAEAAGGSFRLPGAGRGARPGPGFVVEFGDLAVGGVALPGQSGQVRQPQPVPVALLGRAVLRKGLQLGAAERNGRGELVVLAQYRGR